VERVAVAPGQQEHAPESLSNQALTWAERDALLEEHFDSASRCPTCQSANTRQSRYRRDDGYARRFFFNAHRCRRCGRRYFEARRSTVGGSVAAAFATFTLFVALGAGVLDMRDLLRPSADPAQVAGIDGHGSAKHAAGSIARQAELEDAAESGDAEAQFELGRLYLDELGGLQDLAQARGWVNRAAEQGHVGAQSLLGHMYHAGHGALQSFTLAHDWLMRAARQNDAAAQFSLGVMYREGQAVGVDPVAAYSWFNLAASQGLEDARDARDELLTALSPAQVLAAQTASEQWKPGDLAFKSESMLAATSAE
jgi:transposase-like protein